jgi:hypothetical protein
MPKSKETVTVSKVLASLRKGEVAFSPFFLTPRREIENSNGQRPDFVLEMTWNGTSHLFTVECRASATPAVLEEAIQQIRRASRPPLLWPMLFAPYLSDANLQRLEQEGVSGLDLCGNGVVIVPGEWLVYRTGRPNLYPQSFPIKNIFRGTSSLVARVFLLRRVFGAVGEIRAEIERREGAVALSTVSKVLTRLEEELIVGRRSGEIRLLQQDKLLQNLSENYRPPEVTRRFLGKTINKIGPETLLMPRLEWARENQISLAMTGVSSARLYAGTPREPTISFYCSDAAALLERLGSDVREQNHFPDMELLETKDDSVYFDRRLIGGCAFASPLQTYLELARGGKREQETAEQVKLVIWRDLTKPTAESTL